MKFFIALTLVALITGCASESQDSQQDSADIQQVIVTGERVSRDSLKGEIINSYTVQEYINVMEELGPDGFKKLHSFTNCKDLLKHALEKGLIVSDLEDQSVTLMLKSNVKFQKKYDGGGCTN